MMTDERGTLNNKNSSFIPHPSYFLWLLVAILLTAAALRLIGITQVSPPGITHDEVANWLIDHLILSGEHAVYFTRAYGHEAGYHYWQALLVALIGDNALALRLASAYLGLIGVAVTFALARKLFGWQVGIIAMGITAVLFFPVFYSRLGLRAISLPVFSGLSAYFWWRAWSARKSTPAFALAGLFAGLSFYTYMAARAVPIFYGLFIAYLALFHWREFKQRWRGVVLFGAIFAVIAAPLAYYLITNPGSEFRISELDAPLRALMAGDLRPVLENALKILLMFGVKGDPLWRQGVAGMPVFELVVAFLFYLSLPLCLWRWRDARYGFLLLWLATAVIPSLVTINAPSTIRMINLLPVLGIFPALIIVEVIHKIPQLSTVIHYLSTGKAKISTTVLLIFGIIYACWTAWAIYVIWPQGGDVPFVWQTALRDIGNAINEDETAVAVAVGGWSPDTMDPATMALYLNRENTRVSTFGLESGDDIIYTLVIPNFDEKTAASTGSATDTSTGSVTVSIFHPTALPLDPALATQLKNWDADLTITDTYTHYALRSSPPIAPQNPASPTTFGNQLKFLGTDQDSGELITYWQVVAPITQPMRLFFHVLDENGEILMEDYSWDTADPQTLWQPHWQVGDLVLQKHQLPQPLTDATPIRLGIFDPYSCNPGPCQNLITAEGEPFLLFPVQQ
ncbi:MAG: glycosyltransferase family 39 protein [Anaerolineae bacterium]|nr:glycosyltransferase family 39 protein [Anaerolineae bacterium]